MSVTTQPMLVHNGGANFQFTLGGPNPAPQTIPVMTNGTQTAFTTTITPISGGNWLSVTPSSGTTPASLTVTANPAGLTVGVYMSDLKIQGPINTLDFPVPLYVSGTSAGPGVLSVAPTSLTFTLPAAQTAPSPLQTITISTPVASISVFVSPSSGGDWLSASAVGRALQVTASTANLGPGAYVGSVTITSAPNLMAIVPVQLTVSPATELTQLTVSPSSLSLQAAAGATGSAILNVTIVSGPPSFTIQGSLGPAGVNMNWQFGVTLVGGSSTMFTAPGTIQVSATAAHPGTYQGTITIVWNGGSAAIPITYYATPTPTMPPIMTAVVAAGSAIPGSIVPGELITIFGEGLGGTAAGFELDSTGKVATNLGGTEVRINGLAAPLIYASPGQLNAIVPYEAGSGAASVQVSAGGLQSAAWAIPLAATAPSTALRIPPRAAPHSDLRNRRRTDIPSLIHWRRSANRREPVASG